jgi:hypothetical protein
MDTEEVRRFVDVSLAHSIVVDVSEVVEAPGNLRTITIHRENRVTIEFQKCIDYVEGGIDGGGLKYVGQYTSLEEIILDLECYLGRPATEWTNRTSNPYEPKLMSEPDPAANFKHFEDRVRRKDVELPVRAIFEIAGIYWRHIDLFGEYRLDRLGEETEIALRKRGISEEDL